jgi:hypothetical protein
VVPWDFKGGFTREVEAINGGCQRGMNQNILFLCVAQENKDFFQKTNNKLHSGDVVSEPH